jgi:hypothetical protein
LRPCPTRPPRSLDGGSATVNQTTPGAWCTSLCDSQSDSESRRRSRPHPPRPTPHASLSYGVCCDELEICDLVGRMPYGAMHWSSMVYVVCSMTYTILVTRHSQTLSKSRPVCKRCWIADVAAKTINLHPTPGRVSPVCCAQRRWARGSRQRTQTAVELEAARIMLYENEVGLLEVVCKVHNEGAVRCPAVSLSALVD